MDTVSTKDTVRQRIVVADVPNGDDQSQIGSPLLQIPLRGGAITYKEKGNLKTGQFSNITNMRSRHPGYEKRKGQSKLHTTADGTNKAMSMFHFHKTSFAFEDHFLVQWSDGDIQDATTFPPGVTTGAFGSEIFSGNANPIPASWSTINDILVMSNGADQHKIYGGEPYTRIDRFIKYDASGAPPAIPQYGFDYTAEVTDIDATTVAILDNINTYANNECLFIKTPVPATNGLYFWVKTGAENSNVAAMNVYYKKSDGTWADTSAADGTSASSKTLAQPGAVQWTAPTDEISSYMYGECGFWYQVRFSAQLSATVRLTGVTYGALIQDIRNIWDGVPVESPEVQTEGTSQYYRYSGAAVTLDALGSGKKIYIASADRIEGIYFDVGEVPNATGTAITSLKYWDGDSWNSVGTPTDGTNGLSNTGWMTFPRKTDAQKTQFNTSIYHAYWYELILDHALAADMVVSVSTMPFFDINEFGRVGMTNVVWKDRLIVTFDKYPEYMYVSAANKPMCFNGLDSCILEAADGRPNKIVSMKKFYNELLVWQEEIGTEGGTLTLFQGGFNVDTIGKLVLSSKIGTISNNTTVVVDGVTLATETDEKVTAVAYFVSKYGICKTDGLAVDIISDDIQDYFDPKKTTKCIRRDYEDESWIFYDASENVLRVGLVCGASATVPNIFPVYDLKDRAWTFDTLGQSLSSAVEVTAGSGNIPIIQVGGGNDGYIYLLNNTDNDVSTAIDGSLYLEVDADGYDFSIDEIMLRTKVQAAGNVSIVPYINDIIQTSDIKPMTAEVASQVIRRHKYNVNLIGDHMTFRIKNATASQSMYLQNFAINMKVENSR